MAARLKELRTGRLLTQQELAAKAGVSLNTVNRIERGQLEPRFSTVRKLASALDVNAAELVGGSV